MIIDTYIAAVALATKIFIC